MNQTVDRRNAPSLLTPRATEASPGPASLVDLMYDGFYALFLLRNGSGPEDGAGFPDRLKQFLDEVDSRARKLGLAAAEIEAARYAYCAAVDETILRSSFAIREQWETRPLQLLLFGDQLAGEHFFDRLEALRARGGEHLQALEVFHMCLLLGFQGRYALDGPDKLSNLATRLGDEIARLRGKSRGFAPHAERPDHIAHRLRSDLSLWVLSAVFALAAVAAYTGFRASLRHDTEATLAGYNDLVKLPPLPPKLIITLP